MTGAANVMSCTLDQHSKSWESHHHRVLALAGISLETAAGYRLYDVEVIEVSPSVSFLVLLPPVEQVCIAHGQTDQLAERKDCVLLPVQVFETSELRFMLYTLLIVKLVCKRFIKEHTHTHNKKSAQKKKKKKERKQEKISIFVQQ